MEKYPVTSSRGNEYLVKVKECSLFVDHYEVGIYKSYIGWFNRVRYEIVNETFMGYLPTYDIKKFNMSIIEMVTYLVNKLESDKEEKLNKIKLLEKAEEEFKNWDGNC